MSSSVARAASHSGVRQSALETMRKDWLSAPVQVQTDNEVFEVSDFWFTAVLRQTAGEVDIVSSDRGDPYGERCGEIDLYSLLERSLAISSGVGGEKMYNVSVVNTRGAAGFSSLVFAALDRLFSGDRPPSELCKSFMEATFPLIAPLCEETQCESLCIKAGERDFSASSSPSDHSSSPFFQMNLTKLSLHPRKQGYCRQNVWEWSN